MLVPRWELLLRIVVCDPDDVAGSSAIVHAEQNRNLIVEAADDEMEFTYPNQREDCWVPNRLESTDEGSDCCIVEWMIFDLLVLFSHISFLLTACETSNGAAEQLHHLPDSSFGAVTFESLESHDVRLDRGEVF